MGETLNVQKVSKTEMRAQRRPVGWIKKKPVDWFETWVELVMFEIEQMVMARSFETDEIYYDVQLTWRDKENVERK